MNSKGHDSDCRCGCFDIRLSDYDERIAEVLHLRAINRELLKTIEIMIKVFSVKEVDPLSAFITLNKAQAAIEKAKEMQ